MCCVMLVCGVLDLVSNLEKCCFTSSIKGYVGVVRDEWKSPREIVLGSKSWEHGMRIESYWEREMEPSMES